MFRSFRDAAHIGYGAFAHLRNLSVALLCYAGVAYADQVKIVAFGDSLTAGYGLAPEDGFVPQMELWLTEQGIEVELVNAGVPGDTTAGGLSRIAWSLTPDVDGMIVALGANDYLRGLPPELAEENLRGVLATLDEAEVDVLLVGMNVGSNFGPDYKEAFDAIYPNLVDEFETLYFRTWFAGLLASAGMQEGFSEFMQADGLHPNAEGVKVIVAAMGPAVLDLVALARE